MRKTEKIVLKTEKKTLATSARIRLIKLITTTLVYHKSQSVFRDCQISLNYFLQLTSKENQSPPYQLPLKAL